MLSQSMQKLKPCPKEAGIIQKKESVQYNHVSNFAFKHYH